MIRIYNNFKTKRLLMGYSFSNDRFFRAILMLIIALEYSKVQANRHQTNKNEISNFFQQEIESKQDLDKFLED